MVAHINSNLTQKDPASYIDSGANQHMTTDLETLHSQQPFQGREDVAMGNGVGLQIANTGSSCFDLKTVLHSLKVAAILISIHQFCIDNNYFLILTATSFYVKDNQTGQVILQGCSKDGLYPINLKDISSNCTKKVTAFLGIKLLFLSRITD